MFKLDLSISRIKLLSKGQNYENVILSEFMHDIIKVNRSKINKSHLNNSINDLAEK